MVLSSNGFRFFFLFLLLTACFTIRLLIFERKTGFHIKWPLGSSEPHRSGNNQTPRDCIRAHLNNLVLVIRGAAITAVHKQAVLFVTRGRRTNFQTVNVCARARVCVVLELLPPRLFDLRVNLFQSIREMLGGRHRQLTSLCRVCTKSHLSRITQNTRCWCQRSRFVCVCVELSR